jgi:ubiquinol-cytochrome c reductase cytochrome c subunit
MKPLLLCLPLPLLILLTQTAPTPAAPPAPPRDEAAITRGQKIYTKVGCYQCHGREGQGSSASGPRIGPKPPALAAFLAYVRTPAAEMPPYTTKVLSDADLTDIHAFLTARAPAVPNVP